MKFKTLVLVVAMLCCISAGLMFVIARQRTDTGVTVVSSDYGIIGQENSSAAEVGSTAGSGTEAEETPSEAMLVVYVCGAVKTPGVYEVPEGSRIWDCILAAGGFTEEASQTELNLAETVSDGEKIRVPTVTEMSIEQSIALEKSDGLVNINTATKEELMTLPGIGEARAEAIIAYRNSHGDFAEPSDIMQVSGIKEAAYDKIKDKIKTG